MDTSTFLISLILIMFTIQAQQYWLTIGIVGITLVMTRNIGAIILILAAGVCFFVINQGQLNTYLPVIIIVFVGLAIMLGVKDEQPPGNEMYSPEMLAGLSGGGGYGGLT